MAATLCLFHSGPPRDLAPLPDPHLRHHLSASQQEAAPETVLTPRFYTTDFDEMEEIFSLEKNPDLNVSGMERGEKGTPSPAPSSGRRALIRFFPLAPLPPPPTPASPLPSLHPR